MSKANEPAYPATVSINRQTGELEAHQFGNNDYKTTGISKRDYFAAKAMQGALANPEVKETARARSEWAYEIADAMLAAREK